MAANFSYLTVEERQGLEQAFLDAGLVYDPPTRMRLLDGVNRQFVNQFLPIVGYDPATQLGTDLMLMNRFERLVDGTVPLAQWLRNAARRFNVLPQRVLFEAAITKVTRGSGEATSPVIPAGEAPVTNFDEIDTDGVDDLQEVSFLSVGASRLPAVAKVLVPSFHNGIQSMLPDNQNPSYGAGTGWLIGSDLLITNFHVIRNRSREPFPSNDDIRLQALGAKAHFFFDADEQEGRKIGVKRLIAFDSDRTSDFALLRLDLAPNVAPLPLLDETVELPAPLQTPKGNVIKALAVNIIQHPSGGPKRVALRNNLVYTADYPKLHYFTDTLSGSSGSPVFNDGWWVVALHRGAVSDTAVLKDKRTFGYINQGIQIHAILATLAELAKADAETAAALTQIRDEQRAYLA